MTSLILQLQERIKVLERATDSASLVTPKIYPPVTTAALESAEKVLGFAIPMTLRQIYLQVGNGGFGPGYGLLGLPGGATDDLGKNLVSIYQSYRQSNPDDPYWDWPQRLLPVCYLGCAMYACVDCNTAEGMMISFEPNPHQDGETWDDAFISLAPSMDAWLQAWLEDKDLLQAANSRSTSTPLDLDVKLKKLLRQKKKISAITLYQKYKLCSLEEARQYIESL